MRLIRTVDAPRLVVVGMASGGAVDHNLIGSLDEWELALVARLHVPASGCEEDRKESYLFVAGSSSSRPSVRFLFEHFHVCLFIYFPKAWKERRS